MNKLILIFLVFVSLTAQAYEPMVREDVVWDYSDIGKCEFSGTEEKDGKIYHKYHHVNADVNDYFLVREEGRKVYVYIGDEGYFDTVFDASGLLDENGSPFDERKELLLYDFDMNIGDSYITQVKEDNSNWLWFLKVYVVGKGTFLDTEGKERAWILLSIGWPYTSGPRVTVWEGIGPENGPLIAPWGFIIKTCDPMDPGNWFNPYLSEVCKKDSGEVIYRKNDYPYGSPSTGIDNIMPNEQNKNSKTYDLTGREIRNPQRGAIYIQDGEKHIAR